MSFVCPDKNCRNCPRLIAFREGNIVKFPTYYNGPVEPFGSLDAEILVVGLAPGTKRGRIRVAARSGTCSMVRQLPNTAE